MIRQIIPDYEIKLGIKDKKVVNIDWEDIPYADLVNFYNQKDLIRAYLEGAIELLYRAEK